MGYRAYKEEEKNRKRVRRLIALCIVAVLVIGVVVFSFFVPPTSWKYYFHQPNVAERKEGELRIHFLNVGQGDATLLELPDGKIALIDGGKNNAQTKKSILRYMNALEIDVIDYLIVTHTDSDHCGALPEVFRFKKVLNAYLPPSFTTNDGEYAQVYNAAVEEGCEMITSSRGISLSKGGETPYVFQFLYPYSQAAQASVSSDNEGSAIIWLDYQGVSALFCGDAPTSVEKQLVREDILGLLNFGGVHLSSTEILKVAHHGSEQSTSEDFLQYIGVQKAVISCGENSYGHPKAAVLARLERVGADVYRTDKDGHIMATIECDGSYELSKIS